MEITYNQIAEVPPRETARWLTRFAVMSQTLEAVRAEWIEGWGEGGAQLYYATQDISNGIDASESRDYQRAKLLELSRLLPDKKQVPDIVLSPELNQAETERILAEIDASRQKHPQAMYSDAYARWLPERKLTKRLQYEAASGVGIIEEDDISVGALSVYALKRADIRQAADRHMYEHEAEIRYELDQLKASFRARPVKFESPFRTLYGDGSATPSTESYEKLWGNLAVTLTIVDATANGSL